MTGTRIVASRTALLLVALVAAGSSRWGAAPAVAFPTASAASATCPVCFDSKEETRLAFMGTTALLTLLPLGLVGGVGMWIRRRYRSLDRADGSELDLDHADRRTPGH